MDEAFSRMNGVIRRLLDPDAGCPWDLKQTPDTVRLYILEETYELLEAVEADADPDIVEELGDCLFMLCFLARQFEIRGRFNLIDALNRSADKMIARHPHIFADGPKLAEAEQVKAQWHEIKKKEKQAGLLDSVPKALPGLMRAHRLTERAGRVGFDWDESDQVFPSIQGEIEELKEAAGSGDKARTAAELGDVLFTLANLARHLKVNAEDALRGANDRFTQRFSYIEKSLAESGRTPEEASLEEMDRLWEEAKLKGQG